LRLRPTGFDSCCFPAILKSCFLKDTPSKPVVVIVDDEVQLRRLLRICLEANGYSVFEAPTGQMALAEIAARRPDVVVLDLGLPDMDGVTVLTRLREWTDVPVIVLSVRDGEQDKIQALQTGADDYLTKPFGTGELLARLTVARRHAQARPYASVFQAGALEVDLSSRQVKVKGRPIKLTGTEYALLRLFVQNAGKVLTHPQILEAVWGPANVDKTHYLHVYVTHLREKIELDPAKPELIVTEPRIGYRLNTDFSESKARAAAENQATRVAPS
jgi:two-component system, OmpR family, KDP operon response regulator KdpE